MTCGQTCCFRSQPILTQANGNKTVFDGHAYLCLAEIALGSDEYQGILTFPVELCQWLFPGGMAVCDKFLSVERLSDKTLERCHRVHCGKYCLLRLFHCGNSYFLQPVCF